jgi:hypothetical protein
MPQRSARAPGAITPRSSRPRPRAAATVALSSAVQTDGRTIGNGGFYGGRPGAPREDPAVEATRRPRRQDGRARIRDPCRRRRRVVDELDEQRVRRSRWLPSPPEGIHLGTYAYVALILAVLALLRLDGSRRDAVAVVALYLAVFEWETVLVEQPSVTRVVLLGALLVALIVARPQGLLGTPAVDVA